MDTEVQHCSFHDHPTVEPSSCLDEVLTTPAHSQPWIRNMLKGIEYIYILGDCYNEKSDASSALVKITTLTTVHVKSPLQSWPG